mmetsp:Transcript_35519/g.57156  ORF Transcript_35519/g.57156 Transcript_35519/m.57156 type:complete len:222 (-) Transcript_35519:359-1024(-)
MAVYFRDVLVCLYVAMMQLAMVMAASEQLTPHQQMLSDLWEEHCRYEFSSGHKSVGKTMETMIEEPYVNHIPTSIGGVGKSMLRHFYGEHFIFSNPEIILRSVSRTVGQSQLVDELVLATNHSVPIPWLLPGVAPTGRQLEFPLVAIVRFEKNLQGLWRLAHEHIYWDQAGVLAQVGLLDETQLPIIGHEQAKKVIDANSATSNHLLGRAGLWHYARNPEL